ncbi:MAG: helix-turn-helix domain-containing protein [Nannocystaceae bacterium]
MPEATAGGWPEEMVSVTTACSILGVSWAALHRLVDEGRLVGERVGKRLRFVRARVAELAEELARERSLEEARAGEWGKLKKGEGSLLRTKTRAALSRSGIRREEALAMPLDRLRRLPGVGAETVADVLFWRRRTGGEQPTTLSARPCFTREEKISVVRSLAASPVETLERVRMRTGREPQEILALLQRPVVHLAEIARRSGTSVSTLLDFWEHPGRTTMETVAGVALAVEQERALVDMMSGGRPGAEPLGGPASGLVSPATPHEPPVRERVADAPTSASDEPELSVDELSGLLKVSASVIFTQAGSFPGARWDGQTWRFQQGPLLAGLGLPPDERPDLIGRRVALAILGRCSLDTLLGRREFWGRKIVGRWRYDRRGVLAYAHRAGKLTSDEVAKWLLV